MQIQPNSRRNGVAGSVADLLKIRLRAQPIDGKANEALIAYLSDVLAVPKSAVTITHGHTAKRKIVELRGSELAVDTVCRNLLALAAK